MNSETGEGFSKLVGWVSPFRGLRGERGKKMVGKKIKKKKKGERRKGGEE